MVDGDVPAARGDDAVAVNGTFSALVAMSCAGATSKMSHNAASTGSDSRSETWVTSRHTCTDDKVMPRSASRARGRMH